MTNIYIYCLFDAKDVFFGVYSSLKVVHRDALKICNKGTGAVVMQEPGPPQTPTLKVLRNAFRGVCEVMVTYRSGPHAAKILKTRLKE